MLLKFLTLVVVVLDAPVAIAVALTLFIMSFFAIVFVMAVLRQDADGPGVTRINKINAKAMKVVIYPAQSSLDYVGWTDSRISEATEELRKHNPDSKLVKFNDWANSKKYK